MENSVFNIFDRCLEKFPIFQAIDNSDEYTFSRKSFYGGKLLFSANIGSGIITIVSVEGHKFKMVLNLNEDTGHTFEIFDMELIMEDDFCLELLKMNIVLLNPEYDVVRILRMDNLKDILNDQFK